MKFDKNILVFVVAVVVFYFGIDVTVKTFRPAPIELPPLVGPVDPTQPTVPTEPQVQTIEQALSTITSDEIKRHLVYLASPELEGRMSGKKGNKIAAEYIKKQFESYGLKTQYDRFLINRMNPGPNNESGDDFTQNVYGWIEGSDPQLKNEIVIIGAHMDHIGYGPQMSRSPRRQEVHPGADDNASGTSALLEIAQAIAKLKPKRTVVFQAYSAEEMGLIGSRHYCNNPKFPEGNPNLNQHVAMINMDMIGYLNKGYYFAGFNEGESSPELGQIIDDLNRKYSFAKKITSRGGGGSDHASFYNKKIPVAFLHTGLHDYYHTPDDTADKINYDGAAQVAKYAAELAWQVSESPGRPQFALQAFEPLPYVHDHGHTPFERPYRSSRIPSFR